jgi:nitroimidazol reductase NimA-like FMN-containing flavoprotein (pyridoxamine 5'-phosphate oxidase superfamily)
MRHIDVHGLPGLARPTRQQEVNMRIKKNVEKLLRFERVCRIATSGRSGVPHVVPVVPVFDSGKIYFGSDGDAKKVENLRANPHAALTMDVYSEEWSALRGVMVQGTAKLIDKGPRFRKLRRLLYDKYPQYPEDAALEDGSVIVEITPQHVFSWGLD